MTNDLDTLLENLHSDVARKKFLNQIYVPGNTEVADRILRIDENLDIIEKEINHARNTGNTQRFRKMAKKLIDYDVKNDFDISLKDIVIKWKDPELADYTIQRMSNLSKDKYNLELSLEYASEIAKAFGHQDVAKELLEKKLSLQEKDSKYLFTAAQTLKKLGRFDEAIDKYIQCNEHGWLSQAMSVAKEHSPARIQEVARTTVNSFDNKNGYWKFYIECAEQIGETEKAEKRLLNHAKKVKIDSPPRFYQDVVDSLIRFNHDKEAKNLVSKVERHEKAETKNSNYKDLERSEEMAKLYVSIGEIEKAIKIYDITIKTSIEEGHHPSNIINKINKAIELTGDQSFRERQLDLYERQGKFQNASGLAYKLGKTELAGRYAAMFAMNLDAKNQKTQTQVS